MITIGLLICHSDNYYAQEYEIPRMYSQELSILASHHNATILAYEPVKDGEQARKARVYFEKNDVDYLMILCAAFCTGDIMMQFDGWHTPIGVWAAKEPKQSGDIQLNAVVSMNMYISIAQRSFHQKVKAKWFYGSPDQEQFRKRFQVTLQAMHGMRAMRKGIIGILGEVAPTFYNLETDGSVEKGFGLRFLHISMEDMKNEMDKVSKEEIEVSKNIILASAKDTTQLPYDSLLQGAKVLSGLCRLVDHYHIDALAACCWPEFQDEFSIVPCVPFTLLASIKQVPVACEGDIGGAITQLIAQRISGHIPTLMDVTAIDPVEDELLLWHCGIGSVDLQPAESTRIVAHPMLDRKNPARIRMGLSYDYTFKPVPVTLLRYSNNHQLFAVDASIKDKQVGFTGTRGHIGEFMINGKACHVEDVIDILMGKGIEHHLIICPDHCEQALKEFAQLMGISFLSMETFQDEV